MTRLARLTSLRAFAALSIFGYHLGFDLHWTWMARRLPDGFTGVAFFFVLSGFVLGWAFRPDMTAARFYRSRLARIYPTYLVCVLATVALFNVFSGGVIATNVLGVQAWWTFDLHESVLHVFGTDAPAWSVSCELAFYAVTPLILSGLRRLATRDVVTVGAVWLLATQVTAVALTHVSTWGLWSEIAYVNPVVRSGEFVLGMATAVVMRRGWRPPWNLTFAVVVLAVSEVLEQDHRPRFPTADTALILAFWLLITAAAGADLAGRWALFLRSRPLTYAGEISYAFYLVQFPVFYECVQNHLPVGTACVVSVIGTTAGAIAVHHLVERPGQRAIMRARRPRPRTGLAAGPGGALGVWPATATRAND